MSNKLFSDPIISTNEDLDKDYKLDDNGVDLDPNNESFYDQNDDTPDLQDTQDKVYSDSETKEDNHLDVDNSDIFQTAPLDESVNRHPKQVNYNDADEIKQKYNDTTINEYEDEPDLSDRNKRYWIIFGLIAVIILICLGWFIYAQNKKAENQQPKSTTTIIQQTPQPTPTQPQNTTPQQSQDDSSYDDSYDNSGNSGSGGGSYNGSSDNSDYNSDSSSDSDTSSDSSSTDSDNTGTTEQTPTDDTTSSPDSNSQNSSDSENAQAESNSESSSQNQVIEENVASDSSMDNMISE